MTLLKMGLRNIFVYFLILFMKQTTSDFKVYRKENGQFIEIKTESGWIRGKVNRIQDKEIISFLGVPYAKAPTGEGRFSIAKSPADPWPGIKSTTEFGPDCYSIRDNTFPGFSGSEMWNGDQPFSEDCLNLNIWAPRNAKNATILVWIFGGGFFSGTPSLDIYDGSILAAMNDVIVVNINYRLGPFGFLYLDDVANLGLLDQQIALQWLNRHLQLFGGDPHQVTLFGESAGAASVSSHLLAPDSWPLFRYAILQSGTVTCPWATKTVVEARRSTNRFLSMIGCENGNDNERLNCARRVSAKDIMIAYDKLSSTGSFLELHFVPVEEDSTFFQGNIHRSLERGRFKKTAVITGAVMDEAPFWLPYYLPNYFNNTSESLINRREYWNSINVAFSDAYYYSPILRKSIAYQYISSLLSKEDDPWHVPKTLYRGALSKAVGDFLFGCQTLDFGDLLTKHGSVVYTFLFNERSSTNEWPEWMGVMHGYEIEYFFGVPLRKQNEYSTREIEFSRKMMHYWASFAKHGEPQLLEPASRPGQYLQQHGNYNSDMPRWPIYGPERRYLILQSAPMKAGNSWIERRTDNDDCGFWREINQIRDAQPNTGFSDRGLGALTTNFARRCINQSIFAYVLLIELLWLLCRFCL